MDILAFGSHPDDVEFSCGGILARMADQGKSIVIADLTKGEKGTHGTPEERWKEAQSAAKLIGAERIQLSFFDCEIIDTYDGRLELVKIIRKYRPRVILAPQWEGLQNHPDHIATGIMARHACRYARFSKILPELPIHRVEGILHYIQPKQEIPADFLIDISSYVGVWEKMMRSHASQLKTFNYVNIHMNAAGLLGSLIGTQYAQGLIKGNPVVVDDLMTVAKGPISL